MKDSVINLSTKLLLTGSSGFLGSIINNVFKHYKIQTTTLSRTNSDINIDLSKDKPKLKNNYDVVVHAAGKAHSSIKSIKEEREFHSINVEGTKNLLDSLTYINTISQFIFISSVSVYGKESGNCIKEYHPLTGQSAYADSKIEAEQLINDWCKKSNIPALILRLPLVVGSEPPGNLGRMISAIRKGRYLSINAGKARRSMVMGFDVAHLISTQAKAEGIYNLTDGYHPSFREIEEVICHQLNKSLPPSIPPTLAKVLGKTGDYFPFLPVNSDLISKMSQDLTFDDSKARQELNWKPCRVIDNFDIE